MRDHLSRLSPGVRLVAALLLSLPVAQAFAAAQAPAASGDEQFNGRWDIKTAGEHPRAWWLEVENAGTAEPKGKFISAFGGDLNVIEEISIHEGILRFGWTRQQRSSADAAPTTRKLVYTAKLV
ncbi:MAG TPA: hypothetical protein VHM93_18380, partial [Candidatus Acidoferrum sp.]|nr:hypothetical protein [Candidatus Acidoferrum sp.]